jgi:hypothetical protein
LGPEKGSKSQVGLFCFQTKVPSAVFLTHSQVPKIQVPVLLVPLGAGLQEKPLSRTKRRSVPAWIGTRNHCMSYHISHPTGRTDLSDTPFLSLYKAPPGCPISTQSWNNCTFNDYLHQFGNHSSLPSFRPPRSLIQLTNPLLLPPAPRTY